MKLKTLALLLATAISAAHAHAANNYTAEGVNTGNYSDSERFYDSAKGQYWQSLGTIAPYNAYTKSGKTFAFAGDLANRIYDSTKATAYDTANELYTSNWYGNLRDDSGTCWYQTSANIIQHWQTYYGVFAKDHANLPYGHTYSKDNLAALKGIQSLEVGMVFYDNIESGGADFNTATDWYFSGCSLLPSGFGWGSERATPPYNGQDSAGGYFKEYFGTSADYAGFTNGLTSTYGFNANMTQAQASGLIIEAMGQKIEGDKLVTETPGQLAYLGLTSAQGGHAITCYGFEVEGNRIKSLLVTNSDDNQYGAFKLYMKEGSMVLYQNEECTTPWSFNGTTWVMNEISHINTPQELKDMYADYTSADTSLEWNGHSNTWANNLTTDALPTDSAGWDVYVDAAAGHEGHYNSYYAEGRTVEFGDHGKAAADITVKDIVRATGMHLNASDSTGYTFTGSDENATIHLSNGVLTKSSTGTDRIENLTLQADRLALHAGTFEVGADALLQASSAIVADGATLTIDGLAVLGNLTVLQGGQIILAAGGQLGADITMAAGSILTLKLIDPSTQQAILGSMMFDTETSLVMEAPDAPMLRSVAGFSAATSTTMSLEDFVQQANAEMDVLQNGQARLVYSNGTIQLQAIPEPTTATLSLMALAALATRRRRR